METRILLNTHCTNHRFSLARLASGESRFPIRSVRTLVAGAGLCLALAGPAQAALVGHWTFDDSANPWAEISGYQPVGTHDGEPIGTTGATVWSAEGHSGGRTGGSLDLTAGNCALRIMNTSQTLDAGCQPTFDDGLDNGMTIAFWAKGFPDTWAPWVSKGGESLGYQVRRVGSENFATFTLRGTSGDDDPWSSSSTVNSSGNSWHHYAAVWDGIAGTRQLYVDGTLDPGVNLTGDFGPSINIASFEYLVLGGRDLGGVGSFTPCLLNDVRIYRMALSQAEVLEALLPPNAAPKLASRNAGASGLRLAWPVGSFGYRLQTSASLSGPWSNAGLVVAVEGNERAAYAPVAAGAQFFRLVK